MKKLVGMVVCLLLPALLIMPVQTDAAKGDSGYEGGISSGQAPSKSTYEYQELCFVSGEPVVFKGTITIKKADRQGKKSATYTYNLKNADKAATLTRVFVMETEAITKENGQVVEQTAITGRPSENIRIGNITYTLRSYDMTRSSLADDKPAIDYYAGNMWGRKVYQVGNLAGAGTVTIDVTADFYGYDQYWSNAEGIKYKYYISSEQKKGQKLDKWGGQAEVAVSSTVTKEMNYVDNQPELISFEGGYVESQSNISVMEYKSSLPEFDSNGISTDNMIEDAGSLQLETLPVFKRLPVPNLSSIRGHWYEEDIRSLYSLEIIKEEEQSFNPQQYMSRAEFTSALMQAIKDVPEDKVTTSNSTFLFGMQSAKKSQPEEKIIFSDIPAEHKYFSDINNAYEIGIISGKGGAMFYPDEYLTVADAITMFIRSLGLENLASSPGAVTGFRDNDLIPAYARSSVYVAERIGLVMGDDMGNLNPGEYITKARAAVLINRFINYMRTGIRADYREHLVNY